ncbi:MAG: NeuD/PglB/VioB family sugar acetyltransferase [Pseudomonadota bacterium]
MPLAPASERLQGVRHALWGSAGHAKVLSALIARRGGQVVALFDNRELLSALPGVPLHRGEAGFAQWVAQQDAPHDIHALVAIGGDRGRDRLALQALMQRHGLHIGTLVHPQASVCDSATLGAGTQILAGACVAAEARLGLATIVNHGAVVDHECVLGDGVHIAPNATLCGCIELGDHVMVGAGAVVLPRVRLGADCVVGAGAVVTKSWPAGSVLVGNPARLRAAPTAAATAA